MSYYQGDYYSGRGDYYRGDPFLGALVPFAVPLIKKGVSALIARAGARGAVGAGAAIAAGAAIGGGGLRLPSLGGGGGTVIQPTRALPGGAPLVTSSQAPRGYHAHKQLAKKGIIKWVKNRYMNPTNPKALRRAIRREDGFCQLAARFGLRRTRPAKLKVAKRKR
jgi:hypothetical protein